MNWTACALHLHPERKRNIFLKYRYFGLRILKKSIQIYNAGNVLFLILIAVALFAALSYVVVHSSRMNAGSISSEEDRLNTARVENYITAINTGLLRLSIVPCAVVDYTPPSGWGAGDKRCHLFHPQGGDVPYQDFDLGDGYCVGTAKPWADLAVGEGCNNLVYAGTSGGNRIYTTTVDNTTGLYGASGVLIGATSNTDGLANTELMLAAGSLIAQACRALGPDWYIPARDEFNVLWASRNTGTLAGTFLGSFRYTSSTETSANSKQTFMVGTQTWVANLSNGNKTTGGAVRCVRRD